MLQKSLIAASISILTACTWNSTDALSFGEPVHTKIETKSAVSSSGNLELEFKIIVKDDKTNAFSFDGTPWQLDIKNPSGTKFAKTQFKEDQLNKDLPGFKISSEKISEDKGSLEYSLVAFVCTKDKTKCYREVHKNKIDWKK